MKRAIALCLVACLACMLCGCFHVITGLLSSDQVMVIPDKDSMGEPKVFEKDGIRLTLTDLFVDTPSELGYYAYYVTDFCGVVVTTEAFTLEEGLSELSLQTYVRSVIANNGHKNVEPQTKDGLWYYVVEKGNYCSYSYSYKGTDAFWTVQFLCMAADAPMLEDLFFLWANTVEVR